MDYADIRNIAREWAVSPHRREIGPNSYAQIKDGQVEIYADGKKVATLSFTAIKDLAFAIDIQDKLQRG